MVVHCVFFGKNIIFFTFNIYRKALATAMSASDVDFIICSNQALKVIPLARSSFKMTAWKIKLVILRKCFDLKKWFIYIFINGFIVYLLGYLVHIRVEGHGAKQLKPQVGPFISGRFH